MVSEPVTGSTKSEAGVIVGSESGAGVLVGTESVVLGDSGF